MATSAERASRNGPANDVEGLLAARAMPSRSELVYEGIVADICTGRLTPGTPLRQERLAERFQVSRQPVQQALLLLRNQGLLRDYGRRGLQVAPVAADLVVHIYELRDVLDGPAARLAAERRTPEWIEAATGIVQAGQNARAARAFAEMIAKDVEFHRAVVEATANRLLIESAEVMWRNVHRVMSEVLLQGGAPEWVWDDHAAILAAIVHRDGARAEQLARHHARHARELILATMAEQPG